MDLKSEGEVLELSLKSIGKLRPSSTTVTYSAMTSQNFTEPLVPREMMFNDDSLVSVITYSVLMVIAAIGNLTVFVTLFRNRKRRSRVNMFIMHLSVADLIVTFVMIPLEIGWHITVSWKAGDIGCRLLMFLRTFGFYLSSFILIAISLDRYLAIARPLSLSDAGRRGKLMLMMAWLFSTLASIPQSVIFHEERHPLYRWFAQCVTFNFFPSPTHELAYNLFNIFTLYLIPLIVIVLCYTLILWEMSKKSREGQDQLKASHVPASGRMQRFSDLRRSGLGRIEKARIHTLKMTIVIVLVFIICWTPYFVILAWWWLDKETAGQINHKIQRGLFIFAVSNSCMNPIVYGMFTTVFRRELTLNCCCPTSWRMCREPSPHATQQYHFRCDHVHLRLNSRTPIQPPHCQLDQLDRGDLRQKITPGESSRSSSRTPRSRT